MSKQNRYGKIVIVSAFILALGIILVISGWYVPLSEVLIPGQADITKEALAQLVDDLAGGRSVGDSVTVFCRQIIEASSAA